MNQKKTCAILLLLPLLFDVLSVKAQSSYSIEFNASAIAPIQTGFYVEQIIDGRKDTLNNGFTLLNKKKVPLKFEGGLAFQLFNYVEKVLPLRDTSKLSVILRISKLGLSERTTAREIIAKADMAIEFLRNVNGELTKVYELHTWMEKSAFKDGETLHEKNVREIVNRILKQFNETLLQHSDEIMLKPQISFKVINPDDEQPDDDTLYWSSARKLNWNDFKGNPTNEVYAAQSNCAFAQSIIPIVENGAGIFYISVRAGFFKESSWVRKDQNTPVILLHEQLHFDIAEWQIRQLRKEIASANLNLGNYLIKINSLYNEAWNRYNAIQNEYDTETDHGTIPEDQEKWAKKVEMALNEFNNDK